MLGRRATFTQARGRGSFSAEARRRVYGVCLFVLVVQLLEQANDKGANDEADLF